MNGNVAVISTKPASQTFDYEVSELIELSRFPTHPRHACCRPTEVVPALARKCRDLRKNSNLR
jgi:hypothetical protein